MTTPTTTPECPNVTPVKSRRGGARAGTGPKPRNSKVHAGQRVSVQLVTPDYRRSTPERWTITHASKREIVLVCEDGRALNIIL